MLKVSDGSGRRSRSYEDALLYLQKRGGNPAKASWLDPPEAAAVMPMRFEPCRTIPDIIVVHPEVFRDARGYFYDTFQAEPFAKHDIPTSFAQESQSRSDSPGVIRGLHLQLDPFAQGKVIRCSRGAIFDVAVDLRPGSSTFGKHESMELRSERANHWWLPAGFAHGFAVLEAPAEVQYKMTAPYSPRHERTLLWDDPDLGIDWPVDEPLLSDKDRAGVSLDEIATMLW